MGVAIFKPMNIASNGMAINASPNPKADLIKAEIKIIGMIIICIASSNFKTFNSNFSCIRLPALNKFSEICNHFLT